MNPDALTALAATRAEIAVAHHLLLILGAVFLWLRRDIGRLPSILMTAAFGSAAWVQLGSGDAVLPGAVCAVLALTWFVEVLSPASDLSFRGTPRGRLLFSLATFAYALAYPGYTTGLPLFLVSPVGVLLPPTLLVALSLLNTAAPRVRHQFHWAHVAAGLVFGVWGLVSAGWMHAPLVAASLYGVWLLARGSRRIEDASGPQGKVRDVRDRMYARKTLLPGPRKYGRRLDVRSRRRTGGRR